MPENKLDLQHCQFKKRIILAPGEEGREECGKPPAFIFTEVKSGKERSVCAECAPKAKERYGKAVTERAING